jgi:5'(3')-deoxyribonucleotidase
MKNKEFIVGLDLDGCVADFYDQIREFYAEWSGKNIDELPREVKYGMPEWGLNLEEYTRLHRYCVRQKRLFEVVKPITGAPQAIRELSKAGIRIRIITHRLFVPYFHAQAASQTIMWLEKHGIPYRDLCLIEDKAAVSANLYVEDTEKNIKAIQDVGRDVICFSNSTNRSFDAKLRAENWSEAQEIILAKLKEWQVLNPDAGIGPGKPNLVEGDEEI